MKSGPTLERVVGVETNLVGKTFLIIESKSIAECLGNYVTYRGGNRFIIEEECIGFLRAPELDSIALQTDYVALHVSDLTSYDLAIELLKRGVGLIVLARGSGAMNVSSSDTRGLDLASAYEELSEIGAKVIVKNLSKFSPSTGRQVFWDVFDTILSEL